MSQNVTTVICNNQNSKPTWSQLQQISVLTKLFIEIKVTDDRLPCIFHFEGR